MNPDPITESQGKKIISLLEDILKELKGIGKDVSSTEWQVKCELPSIRKAIENLPR